MTRQNIAADLSPLKVILSSSEWLQCAFKEGYNLTLISGKENQASRRVVRAVCQPLADTADETLVSDHDRYQGWRARTMLRCFLTFVKI